MESSEIKTIVTRPQQEDTFVNPFKQFLISHRTVVLTSYVTIINAYFGSCYLRTDREHSMALVEIGVNLSVQCTRILKDR